MRWKKMPTLLSKRMSAERFIDINQLADMEYYGAPGYTQRCLDALVNVLSCYEAIESAWLLSSISEGIGEHSILLNIGPSHRALIKPGLSSGYSGEGPKGLSTALEILQMFNIDIDEYYICADTHQRCIAGCLLSSDIKNIERSRPVRPSRFYEYIDIPKNWNGHGRKGELLHNFSGMMNIGLLDERIIDLAIGFEDNPDSAISSGFRRLEDIIRQRVGAYDLSGRNLFKRAFEGDRSVLHWNDLDGGEQAGKANLFMAVFQAYRNPRAHREVVSSRKEALREFTLINQLFLLEASAVTRLPELKSQN